ncbi:MAG: hemolysin III family protein [Oscillospiraceae bacterium]|nr:hemolysin III family protein [Oscillospiraceae bacterium]
MEYINAAYPPRRPSRLHSRGEQGRSPYDGLRPWSAITHGIGAALSVLGAIFLLVRSVLLGLDAWHLVSFSIYSFSMICLYTASTLYHCVNTSVSGRLALRKYDHCSIALLIAGSYTPICLTVLRTQGAWGWIIFGVIWAMAAASCCLSLLWISSPRWLTSGVYLVMGWMALFALYPLSRVLPTAGFFWLVLGGVLYTVGGILYAVKWPGRDNPRFGCHEVFHLFILAGSICHFFLMYRVICFL